MKFRITCPKCGGLFDVNGESGESIVCGCPYCSHDVECRLPVKEPSVETVHPTEIAVAPKEEEPRKTLGCWAQFLIVFLFLIVCLLIGTFILVRLTQPERYGGI